MLEQDDQVSLERYNSLKDYIEANPLHEIALTSAGLGLFMGLSLALIPYSSFKPIPIYFVALSIFHFSEFFTTARYNRSKVNKDSFLINHGYEYLLAHLAAILEASLEFYFFPNLKRSLWSVKVVGLVLVVIGQAMRTMAMVTLGESFSHLIAIKKQDNHELIQNGVYSFCRHPSYTGFFYWALGTEMLLLNPICFLGFFRLLWVFFSERIKFEERYLLAFFGDKYADYRKSTKVWIPFI